MRKHTQETSAEPTASWRGGELYGDSIPDSYIRLEKQDKDAPKKSDGQSQDLLKKPLGRTTEPAKSHTARHGKVSSQALPELDVWFISLLGPVTLSTDYGLLSHMWEKCSPFFFFSPLEISYLRTWRSMWINSDLKGPLPTLHAIRYFLINYQKGIRCIPITSFT